MSKRVENKEAFKFSPDIHAKVIKTIVFHREVMPKPVFSVITTGRGEKDTRALEETFSNWEIAKKVFEEKRGNSKAIEFLVVDAGENAELPEICDSTVISPEEYEEYRKKLWKSGIIKYPWWDTPAIGRNLGFKYAKGRIIVFHDIDSLFSTGTQMDDAYIFSELDKYENYFEVMYHAFKRKDIVATVPSLRPRDSLKLGRRFGIMGANFMTRLSLKFPTIKIGGIPVIGASVPGCSMTLLYDVACRMSRNGCGPYDPELGVAEDQKISRLMSRFGRISYERGAGVFTRTRNRVSDGYDIAKSLGYAIKGSTYYLFPGLFKYRKHSLTI
ncbi:MAG: glycosyltransferase family 2 protein [Candidatus Bathyarchaeota archaeon]|nr:glycosyltransferase family 2 protein [Candidatus Bathyarchaeota archaeon]